VTPSEQLERIVGGAANVFPLDELRARLDTGRALRVKLGVDPTAPDIHLGHTVALTKLRQCQELGHQAVLIIGDYTARIGDPSGRSVTRPSLSVEEIDGFAATYEAQVFKILDRPRTEVRRNSEWFGQFHLDDVLRLVSQMTVARMLERDDFQQRHGAGTPIGLHEFLYPLMQGYDSVVVRADLELGGTDQTFNLAVGRDLQRGAGQAGQVAVLLPLLEGLDGTHKMSKSLGNHIGITDAAEEMYGKLMSISDELMRRYVALLSTRPAQILGPLERGEVHPMDAKKQLAHELVSRYHGDVEAVRADAFFRERFQRRQDNEPIVVTLDASVGEIWICQLLKQIGFAASTSEARRLASQGAVRVDGAVVDAEFRFRPGRDRLVSVGRRRLAEVRSGRASAPS
jgi:tyrosyl-tRNA synthetase